MTNVLIFKHLYLCSCSIHNGCVKCILCLCAVSVFLNIWIYRWIYIFSTSFFWFALKSRFVNEDDYLPSKMAPHHLTLQKGKYVRAFDDGTVTECGFDTHVKVGDKISFVVSKVKPQDDPNIEVSKKKMYPCDVVIHCTHVCSVWSQWCTKVEQMSSVHIHFRLRCCPCPVLWSCFWKLNAYGSKFKGWCPFQILYKFAQLN